MAITGDGSQSTPYLVSTIEEIAEAFTACRAKTTAGTYYVKLNANIDGGWKELETLDYSTNTNDIVIDFNLNSKYIRNFICNECAFKMDKDIFRNGQLYNFYTDTCEEAVWDTIDFVDASVSNYIKTLDEPAYDACRFVRSAIWGTVDDCNADEYVKFRAYSVGDTDGDNQFEESDSKIIIKNLNNTEFSVFEAADSSSMVVGVDSRFQGEIQNITPATITSYPAWLSSYVASENSVFNFEMPVYSGTISGASSTTVVGAGSTGVINTDLLHDTTHSDATMNNLIKVTDTQMHSASELNRLGFEVYDIS